jgi:hypothetical protein
MAAPVEIVDVVDDDVAFAGARQAHSLGDRIGYPVAARGSRLPLRRDGYDRDASGI